MIFDPIYLIILLVFSVIGGIVSSRLHSKFKKYSRMPLSSGLSGKEIAELMLQQNGIYDVKVLSVPGMLTDHYNPLKKTVNLSPAVYSGRSIASAAVAAHECGHAIQHKAGYFWLQIRSALVPIVNFSQMAMQWIYLALLFVGFLGNMFNFALLAIVILQGVITLFSVITLPVEVDASSRALKWLKNTNIVSPGKEYDYAKDALKWAALTYFVAALATIAQLLYFVFLLLGRRDD